MACIEELRDMENLILKHIVSLCVLACLAGCAGSGGEFRRLPAGEYRDKMTAGWIGQMVGVSWGAPTEFRWQADVIPEAEVPPWKDGMANDAFGQDDLYVEMTFLKTLEDYGVGASARQAGIDFANSRYGLWHANNAGRRNLRTGIAPPDSGHPKFNSHADDIDYQIEADFSGLIAPGLPNAAIELGERFGRLMNYGDGLYGGQFVGGMYAEAFFEKNPVKIVEAGLKCIPAESQFAETIRDCLAWHAARPGDWQAAWKLVDEKYQKNPDYRRFSCDKGRFNIDAKLNAAYIALGLLYCGGDPDRAIAISMRCGQDSDCNPSNAAGVICAALGTSGMPAKYSAGLNMETRFSHTAYNFPALIAVCEKLARQNVLQAGGKIEKEKDGGEVFLIPVRAAMPGPLEQSWTPGPVANSRFTPEESARIEIPNAPPGMAEAVEKFAPGWKVKNCGPDMGPGLREEALGRKNVLMTHPFDQEAACILHRSLAVPAGKKTVLKLAVGHDTRGDWLLIVKADGKELAQKPITPETCKGNWTDVEIDLSGFAGRTVALELLNQPTGWAFEAGYWSEISVITTYR